MTSSRKWDVGSPRGAGATWTTDSDCFSGGWRGQGDSAGRTPWGEEGRGIEKKRRGEKEEKKKKTKNRRCCVTGKIGEERGSVYSGYKRGRERERKREKEYIVKRMSAAQGETRSKEKEGKKKTKRRIFRPKCPLAPNSSRMEWIIAVNTQ
jgi:hypothetical protein